MKLRADLINDTRGPEVRDLARKAEKLTGGGVAFLYTSLPGNTRYYMFSKAPMKMTREEVIGWLSVVIKNPAKYRGEPGVVEGGAR